MPASDRSEPNLLHRIRRLMAIRVRSLQCINSVAIGGQRTCCEALPRVDSTRMTHNGSWLRDSGATQHGRGATPPGAMVAFRIGFPGPRECRGSIRLRRQFPGFPGACLANRPAGHSPLPSIPTGSSRPSSEASTADRTARLQSLFDSACLGVDGALADIECGAEVRRRHMRRKRFVTQKIHPPKNIDNAARPRSRLSGSNWARALPAKRPGQCARQVPVFGVQIPVANIVGQADNLLVDWQHDFWNTQARRTRYRISLAEMERCSFINRLVSLTTFEAVKQFGQPSRR